MYIDPPYANTKGMYYGGIELDTLWQWVQGLESAILCSFGGYVGDLLYEVEAPSVFPITRYLESGQSSMRRMVKGEHVAVKEALHIKPRGYTV